MYRGIYPRWWFLPILAIQESRAHHFLCVQFFLLILIVENGSDMMARMYVVYV